MLPDTDETALTTFSELSKTVVNFAWVVSSLLSAFASSLLNVGETVGAIPNVFAMLILSIKLWTSSLAGWASTSTFLGPFPSFKTLSSSSVFVITLFTALAESPPWPIISSK